MQPLSWSTVTKPSRIQEEIDSLADGAYSWPFQSLRLKRRFIVAWYREWNDTYIRLSDLYQLIQALADPYRASKIPTIVKARDVDDVDFPGRYCRLVYGTRLFEECGLLWHANILKPRSSGQGVFSAPVDLYFDLYYHTASQMFNVTTLLRTVPLDLARVATWNLEPQIQEVHGDAQWEGNYIDRQSFEKVLERVQCADVAAVLPDLLRLDDQRAHTRFSTVDHSNAVVVVTRRLTPSWVALSREKRDKSLETSFMAREATCGNGV